MVVELGLRGISFEQQKPVPVRYKDRDVGDGRVELLVEKQLIVELTSSLGMIWRAWRLGQSMPKLVDLREASSRL